MIYLYVNIFKILINNTLKSNKKIQNKYSIFLLYMQIKKENKNKALISSWKKKILKK